MNAKKDSTPDKDIKSFPIRQWFYHNFKSLIGKRKQQEMLITCFLSLVSGLFTGSIRRLEEISFKDAKDRILYIFSRSKINFDTLIDEYERWAIWFMIGLSRISGLPIWIGIDDTTIEKGKRSKKVIKGGKRKKQEGFSFFTAVIGVGDFFIPLIPRQCLRKKIAETLPGIEYKSKLKVAEDCLEKWHDLGLKDREVIILLDCWYMSTNLIKKIISYNFSLIGAIRKNRHLNKKAIVKYQHGLREHQRLLHNDEKYHYRLYQRQGKLNKIQKPVTVLLSQRIKKIDGDKSWKYIACIGLDLTRQEILFWYNKRWAVETFHQIWKSFSGATKWRLQGYQKISNLATVTTFVIGISVYLWSRAKNNYHDLYELKLEKAIIAVALEEVRLTVISQIKTEKFLFHSLL